MYSLELLWVLSLSPEHVCHWIHWGFSSWLFCQYHWEPSSKIIRMTHSAVSELWAKVDVSFSSFTGWNSLHSNLILMRSKISSPEVQPRHSVNVILHLSPRKQILLVYQYYVRVSSWQPDVKINSGYSRHVRKEKKEGETLSLRRNDFFNRDNQKYYLRIQINKLNWEKLLGLSQSGSLPACIFSRRMTVHYWLMWCYISVWSYVSAFTPRPFSDGWLFLEVSQRAALNKLSTGRVTAFPGIIRQMTDSSALHLFSPRPLLIQNLKFC